MNREELLIKIAEESEGHPWDVLSHMVCADVTSLYEENLITDYEEDGDITCTFRLTEEGMNIWDSRQ